MSKLLAKAKNSKLNAKPNNESKGINAKEKLIHQIKPKEYPRSYRLDFESLNTLKTTLNKINEISPKKISEARLVKALIYLSCEIKEEKILRALKEVW